MNICLLLYSVTNNLLKQIKNYMSQIMAYSEIWTVDKLEYFNKFKSSEHTSDDFDEKITMYSKKLIRTKLCHLITG